MLIKYIFRIILQSLTLIPVCAVTALAQYNERELPLHFPGNLPVSRDQYQSAPYGYRKPIGQQELFVHGEFVVWKYPFPWIGTCTDGSQLELASGMRVRFLEMREGEMWLSSNNVSFMVRCPPNVGFSNLIFLDDISIVGSPAHIVVNRIGLANSRCERDGHVILRFTASRVNYTVNEKMTLKSYTTTNGNQFNQNHGATTVTTASMPASYSYRPYDFELVLDKNLFVIQMVDLLAGE